MSPQVAHYALAATGGPDPYAHGGVYVVIACGVISGVGIVAVWFRSRGK
jgi:hypothetical protein